MRGKGEFVQLQRYRCVLLLSGIIFTLTLASTTNVVKGDNINPGLYSTNSAPYGIPYQQLDRKTLAVGLFFTCPPASKG